MTPIADAARAVELVEGGLSQNKTAALMGIPQQTISNIVNKHGMWGEIAERPIFSRYRLEQKIALEAGSRTLAAKLLVHADENYHKMSAYQAVGMYGILRQHERLDAGEPTEITASVNLHAVASLDRLAAMLGHSLVSEESNSVSNLTNVGDPPLPPNK